MINIAIVDDQDLLRDSLAHTLSRCGYGVSTFACAAHAIQAVKKQPFDLIISDLKMPEIDGVEMLRQIRQLGHDLPVILMTAYATVSTAVEAMKLGAFDYIQKPFDADEIELLIKRAVQDRQLRSENEALRRTVNDMCDSRELIGQSLMMRKLRDQIAKIGPSDATALIEGESGTGKEMIARAIHQSSNRA